MIYLGLDEQYKKLKIDSYVGKNGIEKVVILSPDKFKFDFEGDTVEWVEYADIIRYVYYYRLLREINKNTLVVVNECLRTQNRHDLTYNCIRHYLNQTPHVLVFQYLPMIDTIDDFMVLFDFSTQSRWRKERFSTEILKETKIVLQPVKIEFNSILVETSLATQSKYDSEKEKLFNDLGEKDPHTLPRNLYLIGGKDKLKAVRDECLYIGRNNRFKLSNMQAYKESNYQGPLVVFEWCHNFIDFADLIALTHQHRFDVLVSDLKVDKWYFERFKNWAKRIEDGYASLH